MKHSLLLCLWRVFFLISIFGNIFKKSLEVRTPFQPSATLPGRWLNWISEHRPRANEPVCSSQATKVKKKIEEDTKSFLYRILGSIGCWWPQISPDFPCCSIQRHPKTFPPSPNFAWLKPLWYSHSPWHKTINPWYKRPPPGSIPAPVQKAVIAPETEALRHEIIR